VTHARARHFPPGETVIINFSKVVADQSATTRRLDALAVEAALNGRRSYWTLTPAEVAEVLRILHRRGSSLTFVAWLLDVDRHVIAERYAAAGEPQ
jgi:hypothetical protein